MIDTPRTRPATPDIAQVLPLTRRARGPLGLDTRELDELMYAATVRLDTLGTNVADQDTRARLETGRAALERELIRIISV